MSKADAMLSILWLLRARRRMTAAELAAELEVHVRTVYRCIDALCASGVPIVADAGRSGGYRLLERFRDAPLLLTPDEQAALAQAAAFAEQSGVPFTEPLRSAVVKLKQQAKPDLLQEVERREAGLAALQPQPDPELVPVLQELERCAAAGVTVSVDYAAGYDGPVETRPLDPYGLVLWRSRWYVIGFCRLRGAVRSFRADRIRALAATAQRFERPAGFSAAGFLLGSLQPDAASAGQIAVRLQGSPAALHDLCSHWLFGHALVERTDEEALFLLDEMRFYMYAPYALLAYGGSIRVLEPAALKENLIDIAEGLLEHYRSQ